MKLINEFYIWVDTLIRYIPGAIGSKFRRIFWCHRFSDAPGKSFFDIGVFINGYKNIKIGQGVVFGIGCKLDSVTGEINIGGNSRFNYGVILGADGGKITIGKDVLVGPNVVMRASDHRYELTPKISIVNQGYISKYINIGDDVWIGANVTILGGASIGQHSVIGAGAVVKGNIPENSVAVGVPAKVVKQISNDL